MDDQAIGMRSDTGGQALIGSAEDRAADGEGRVVSTMAAGPIAVLAKQAEPPGNKNLC